MNRIYLLLGSNLGEPIKQLSKAKSFITSKIGPIIRSSSLYVTKAWGNTRQPDFINQVIIINTELTPEKLMDTILKIEASLDYWMKWNCLAKLTYEYVKGDNTLYRPHAFYAQLVFGF